MARVRLLVGIALFAFLCGCASESRSIKSSALEYLYPPKAAPQPARDVDLKLPVRVGVAFAPVKEHWAMSGPTEDQKRALLERAAAAFRTRKGIAGVDVIPASSLRPEGGFEEIDRLKQAYGLDVIALVSFDQFQFSESTKASWTYLTIVGAYVVKGERNETRTVLDAVVYDIPSRALLFTASGESRIGGKSTPVDVSRDLRTSSARGFELAIDALIPRLETALAEFTKQAATGTVRGAGTPGIQMTKADGTPVAKGGGALGTLDVALAALLALAAARVFKRSA